LVGKHGGKKPLGRYRRRWKENIKTDLREIGQGAWSDMVQDRDKLRDNANMIMDYRVQ
jgi:hypothetical protein